MEFINLTPENLAEEHKAIIAGWKRRVQGNFIMERNLKKGDYFYLGGGKGISGERNHFQLGRNVLWCSIAVIYESNVYIIS